MPKSNGLNAHALTDTSLRGVSAPVAALIALKQHAIAATSRKPKHTALMAGQYLAKQRGRGVEFAEVRHYHAGDDVRSIDWRITARSGKPHTRLYNEERERPIFIACDLRRNMHFGTQLRFKSVQVANLAALIAWSAIANGDRVGGIIYTDQRHIEIKPSRSSRAVAHFLKTLSDHCDYDRTTADASPQTSFNSALMLAELKRLAKPGSYLFVLSDFVDWNPDCVKQLALINRHNDSHLVAINDVFEYKLPRSGQFPISDGSHHAILDGRQHSRDLNDNFERKMQQIAYQSRQFGSSFSRVNTATNPIEALPSLINSL